jgi:hypothetical protein
MLLCVRAFANVVLCSLARSDRDKDVGEKPPATADSESVTTPPKRVKIVRTHYRDNGDGGRSGAGAFAKKTLPLAEKPRAERRD